MRRAPGCVAGGQTMGRGHQQRAGPGQHEQEPRDPPRPAQATLQRLGMQTGQRGIPSLEVSHLETKPLSPVDIEENAEDDIQEKEVDKQCQSRTENKVSACDEGPSLGHRECREKPSCLSLVLTSLMTSESCCYPFPRRLTGQGGRGLGQ